MYILVKRKLYIAIKITQKYATDENEICINMVFLLKTFHDQTFTQFHWECVSFVI